MKKPKTSNPTRRRVGPKGGLDYGILTGLLGYRLRRAQAVVFSHFLETVGKAGISPGQFGVLNLIKENEGLSQSALAKGFGIERSTMVAVIDGLQDRGWVKRVASKRDRRSYALSLTKAGRAFIERITPEVEAHEREIAANLSGEEKDQLIAMLARIADGEG
ncbi:MAG: MarR family transcriptional regulator [Alphaproteobacteria bacterium]|nr:MarR family transcriptional regulator [Alphaproteobacteria bacterium]